MIFGSILAKLSEFRLDAADGQSAIVRNTTLTRAALSIVGVPHMGLRIRASSILSKIRKHRPKTIIDAGSGNGLYTLEFAARGYIVHGIELNQDKVSRVEHYAQEAGLANASFQIADLTKLAQVTRQADLVICSDVLEHIPCDRGAAFALFALTCSGGILVLTVPRVSPFAARVENSFEHVRIGYTEESLCALIESAGFQILETGYFFKMFGRMAWAADRTLRHSPVFRALMFWPLFLIAKLDNLTPLDSNAGGILIVARKPLDE
jgi:2-polyprenyl-3-methyl-5-hydroxy-6-metoxy-1,4-benzoquinol methylase